MKPILFFCLLTTLTAAKCQSRTGCLYISKLGWRIEVPEGYKISDTMSNGANWDKEGKDKSFGPSYPYNSLFMISRNESNMMVTNLIPYDSKKDGDWPDFISANNANMYNMLNNAMIKADSVSSIDTIGGLQFSKFHIDMKMQNKVISSAIFLHRQFGDHSLGIFLSFGERETGEKLLDILKRSKIETSKSH